MYAERLIIMKNTYLDGLLLFGNLFLVISVLIFKNRLEIISTVPTLSMKYVLKIGIDNLFSFSCT